MKMLFHEWEMSKCQSNLFLNLHDLNECKIILSRNICNIKHNPSETNLFESAHNKVVINTISDDDESMMYATEFLVYAIV